LKLTIVSETYLPEINGVAMTLGRIVDGLAVRGHLITVVRPRQRHESPKYSVTQRVSCRQVRLPGVTIPGYPQLRLGLPAGGTLQRLWTINRPELIHVATEGPLGTSAIGAARRLGIPVTSSFHTNFHQYTGPYHIGWLRRPVEAWLRHLHNRTRLTFVPTRMLLDELAAQRYRNLRILSRGVDTSLFDPALRDEEVRKRWGLMPDDLAVMHVGRIASEKNYPLVFRAFDALKAVAPRARLVLVGDGPLTARMQKERPDAVFTGFYTGANLARHYASGDLYLHASTTETFGNVILEAMASGLPVVSFFYAAAREFIRDGENGIAVPLSNDEDFVARSVVLAGDPALRQRLGANARRTACTLSWNAVIERFEADLLEAVVGNAAA
jgi:glycosyltransferase involved in cell wall biosynthesis